ncbi:MAG: TIGR00730 family Rossman fold protein [Dorea sp.]|nr:TIGR00730 family Rossman fold protein [Dorea sp.]
MKITIYCGATDVTNQTFLDKTVELGRWMGEEGHTLVYGGGKFGLMGILARAVMEKEGNVIGICPSFIERMEPLQTDISEMIYVDTLSRRKDLMIEMGEAYIALPGGSGTLDEISELIALSRLGQTDHPVILYDMNGFYQPLKELLLMMIKEGFYTEKNLEKVHFVHNLEELKNCLNRL